MLNLILFSSSLLIINCEVIDIAIDRVVKLPTDKIKERVTKYLTY